MTISTDPTPHPGFGARMVQGAQALGVPFTGPRRDRDWRASVQVKRLSRSLDVTARDGVAQVVRDLWDDGDWSELADLLEEWDTGGAYTVTGRAKVLVALTALSEHVSKGRVARVCPLPERIQIIPQEAQRRLDRAIALTPGRYELAAIAAHFQTLAAWVARGGARTEALPLAARQASDGAIRRAKLMVAPYPKRRGGILGTAIALRWLPFDCDSEATLRARVRAALSADPMGHVQARWLGALALPRWYGTVADYRRDLTSLLDPGTRDWGNAMYSSAILTGMELDPIPILCLDQPTFDRGILDLIHLRKRDPHVVARLSQRLGALAEGAAPAGFARDHQRRDREARASLATLQTRIVREHLTAYVPSAWPSPQAMLNHLEPIMARNIVRGTRLVVDDRGTGIRSRRG